MNVHQPKLSLKSRFHVVERLPSKQPAWMLVHTYTIVREEKVFLKLFFAPLPLECYFTPAQQPVVCRAQTPSQIGKNHRRDAAQQLNKCKQQDETERMGQIKTLHFHLRKTQMRHDISKCILLLRNA